MRCFLSIPIAFVAAVSVGLQPTPVQARDYPFCIKGDNYESPVGDCSFDTYQQCLEAAFGRHAFCDRNPFFAAARGPVPTAPKKPVGQR